MNVKEMNGGLEITEQIDFKAISVGGKLQPSIRYEPIKDEYLSRSNACVEVKKRNSGSWEKVETNDLPHYGFSASLENYKNESELDVKINVKYETDQNIHLIWTMSELTHVFNLTLNHPSNMKPFYEVLGIDKNKFGTPASGNSAICIACETWALPGTGIVVSLKK